MNVLRRALSRTARSLAAWPLRLLAPGQRADVLDRASTGMITVTEIPGGHIKFFTPAPLLIHRALTVLTKEADTIRWIDGFADGDVLWDVGANVGVFSLYAAVRKRISVHAFEPSAANYFVLTRNIQLNDVSSWVTAYCVALADRTQLGLLNMPSPTMGSALSQFGKLGDASPWASPSRAAVHGMLGYSIDDFLSQFNPLFPNHLKLDVDGIELSILKGAQATLKDPRLKSLLVEVNLNDSDEKNQMFEIVRAAGFSLKSQGDIQETVAAKGANHLFEKTLHADHNARIPY
jgi:FkbM family methyltransferase